MDAGVYLGSSERNILRSRPIKRTRNKPTLNCNECVARKIRCDRKRPRCGSCILRPADCSYFRGQPNSAAPRVGRICYANVPGHIERSARPSNVSRSAVPPVQLQHPRSPVSEACDAGPRVPSELPASHGTRVAMSPIFQVYEEVMEHPFLNYWTMAGGIGEVLSILPTKHNADVLVANYFDHADPLYPIVPRLKFMIDYEYFWGLSSDELLQYDASQLALHFAIYATGARFSSAQYAPVCPETTKMYLSASYQSLCLYSYLSRCSITTIQCMIIMSYHLINKNLLSDAWTFSGIAQRHAYGISLNRSPATTNIELSEDEAMLRCKIWQAIVVQDSMLSLYLQLPPATMHSDLGPESLELNRVVLTATPSSPDSDPFGSLHSPFDAALDQDLAYLRAMWELAVFVRDHVCIPRSYKRPISSSAAHKSSLISQLRAMYRGWRSPFSSHDYRRFEANNNQRLTSQMIGLSSKYFGVLAILHTDENHDMGVKCDVIEALDAAQNALSAFFALIRCFPDQVDRYGGYHIRASAQATIIGHILANHSGPGGNAEPYLQLAKSFFDRYYDILSLCKGTEEDRRLQKRRLLSLESLAARFKLD